MRVRILSGNQTGALEEVSASEGEHLLMSGLAELAPPESTPVPDPAPVVAAPVVAASGASLTDDDTHEAAPEAPEPQPIPARVRRRSAPQKAAPATTRRKRR